VLECCGLRGCVFSSVVLDVAVGNFVLIWIFSEVVKDHFMVIFWVDSVEACRADYGILICHVTHQLLIVCCLMSSGLVANQTRLFFAVGVSGSVKSGLLHKNMISRISFPKPSATFSVLHVVPFLPFISRYCLVGMQVQMIPQRCIYTALQDVCLLCQRTNKLFRPCSSQIWSVLFCYGGMPDHLMSAAVS
jgi:hypothetical protein